MGKPRLNQQVPIQNPFPVQWGTDFKIEKPIGSGAFGQVYLATYHGENEKIKNQIKGKKIAIKQFSEEDKEVDIAPYLSQMANVRPELGQKYNAGFMISDENGTKRLVSEFVSYDPETSSSSDLQKYFVQVNTNSDENYTFQKQFDQNNLAITLSQFAFAMKDTQNALHEAGVFHFDTGARNFLVAEPTRDDQGNILKVNLKISDYGFSEIIPSEGFVHFVEGSNLPLRSLDARTYAREGRSVATDIYALKIAMIEMIGLAMNFNPQEIKNKILCLEPNQSNDDFAMARMQYSNEEVLKKFVENLEYEIKRMSDFNRKAQIDTFLQCYKEFLTHMPAKCEVGEHCSVADMKAIREEDNKRLIDANKNFKVAIKEVFNELELSQHKNDLIDNRLQYIQDSPTALKVSSWNQLQAQRQRLMTGGQHYSPIPLPKLQTQQKELIHSSSTAVLMNSFGPLTPMTAVKSSLSDLERKSPSLVPSPKREKSLPENKVEISKDKLHEAEKLVKPIPSVQLMKSNDLERLKLIKRLNLIKEIVYNDHLWKDKSILKIGGINTMKIYFSGLPLDTLDRGVLKMLSDAINDIVTEKLALHRPTRNEVVENFYKAIQSNTLESFYDELTKKKEEKPRRHSP